MIKVALVDDQENVRRTLCRVLAADGGMKCVAACADGEEALRLIPAAAPDVVLMDLEMPGMKGSAVIERLLEKMPDLDVLVLTVHDDTENIFQALRAGACGYLLKRTPAAGILAAIREAKRGGAPMTGAIARKILGTFHTPAVAPQATLIEGDFGDAALVGELLSRFEVDAIIHFAAKIVVPESVADPLGYYENNTAKARTLLGWRPRLNLDAALVWTAGWYRAWAGGDHDLRELVRARVREFLAQQTGS